MGVAKYLKSVNSKIQTIAVEPRECAILSTGKVATPIHKMEGCGYGVIPTHWDNKYADDVYSVTDK